MNEKTSSHSIQLSTFPSLFCGVERGKKSRKTTKFEGVVEIEKLERVTDWGNWLKGFD